MSIDMNNWNQLLHELLSGIIENELNQLVQENEENITPPPLKFWDGYRPTPKPRTKIMQLNKALKGYDITIRYKDISIQLQNRRKSLEYYVKKQLVEMKGFKLIETVKVIFKKLLKGKRGICILKTAYF